MRKAFIISVFICILSLAVSDRGDDRCMVLALQGGGDHGAYQAGVLHSLASNLPAEERNWDIVTGISAGTLNGAALSIFPIGQEVEATEFILKVWKTIKNSDDIYKNWKPWGKAGPLYALFKKSGFFDSSPERKLLKTTLKDKKILRHFHLGITNIISGEYEVVEASTLSESDLIEAIMASSAVPIIFPTIKFQNSTYSDGGVIHGVDVLSGINECKKQGYAEEKIVIDIIKCFGTTFEELDPTKFTSMQALERMFDIWKRDRALRQIEDLVKHFPKINFRYIVTPTKDLPNPSTPLRFKEKDIEYMISVGEQDGKDILKNGSNGIEYVKGSIAKLKHESLNYKKAQPNLK